jgi:hypothetical protein
MLSRRKSVLGPITAAVLFGHGQVHQPVLAQVGVVLGRKSILGIVAGRAGCETLARQTGDQGNNLLLVRWSNAKGELIG